jgi:hypothetical protein
MRNVGRVEANEVTHLDEGDPPLGDEPPKVPLGGAERLATWSMRRSSGSWRVTCVDFCAREEGLGEIGISFLQLAGLGRDDHDLIESLSACTPSMFERRRTWFPEADRIRLSGLRSRSQCR